MLALTGLTKHYGDIVALNQAGLQARPGRILGFLGPNGAGKTTAMRAIFGLVALDAGKITWQGHPIDSEQRSRFGYMPERRGLYPKMKVAAQVAWLAELHGMPAAEARRSTAEMLERLGLSGRAGDRVETLSHGNQQRAQLAASLVHHPELLVLDEPFSGLDPTGVDAMTEVIHERAVHGATVVFSSHQLDLVEDVCDDLAIIDRGRVVVSGSLDDVRSSAPHRHLEVQFADPSVTWAPADGTTTRARNGALGFLVPAASDPRQLLESASHSGTVTGFHYGPPRLSEIFRAAVGQ